MFKAVATGERPVVVQSLVKDGADKDEADGYTKRTLMHMAAQTGDLEALQALWQLDKVDMDDIYGQTAFLVAAQNNNVSVMKFLLETGSVDINKADNSGSTALFWAAILGHTAVVAFLIKRGADTVKANEDGWTALIAAAAQNHVAAVVCIVAVQLGAGSMNMVNNKGETALFIASEMGSEAVVEILLDNGAAPNIVAKYGRTALLEAASSGHNEVVKVLVQNGAKMKADKGGVTALMGAIMSLQESSRAPPLLPCWRERSSISIERELAFRNERVLVLVQYLLEKGCVVDGADKDGWTALHRAAIKGSLDVVDILVDNGAKLDAKTKKGETPAELATRYGHQAIVDAIAAKEIHHRDHGVKRAREERSEQQQQVDTNDEEEEEEEEEEEDEEDDDGDMCG